jgi:ribosomal protein L37AE/L43A
MKPERTPKTEEQLIKKFDFVRITFDKNKKRPWRVEVWKCKRCRETFVGETKEEVMKTALQWGERR